MTSARLKEVAGDKDMDASHPQVHPVGVPPMLPPPMVRMKDLPGVAGTLGGLALRLGQFGFAVIAFSIMVSIPDFSSVTAFWYSLTLYLGSKAASFSLLAVKVGVLLRLSWFG